MLPRLARRRRGPIASGELEPVAGRTDDQIFDIQEPPSSGNADACSAKDQLRVVPLNPSRT